MDERLGTSHIGGGMVVEAPGGFWYNRDGVPFRKM
jgi:hypothetical protein